MKPGLVELLLFRSGHTEEPSWGIQGNSYYTMAHKVQLALYDLSRGLAKTMSMAILGKQIEGENSPLGVGAFLAQRS